MGKLTDRWQNLSIARRLYVVVGIMATLIAAELITLRFAMHTLSAVRAFVVGEGLWSKAQKNAIFRLERYGRSRDERDYQSFLEHLKIPDGDRRARLELLKPNPDLSIVRQGFLDGHIHPDDIEPMFDLLNRFSWISYLSHALQVWAAADVLVAEFKVVGEEYRRLLLAHPTDTKKLGEVMARITDLNHELTEVEAEFSDVLGEGSRWLERIVIGLLFLAVLIVEAIGLTLTISTGRQISRGLGELTEVAEAIGEGKFNRRALVRSRDEIGVLARSVNTMGELLQGSYQDLEGRVHERTLELERALRARDDFVSIVSHELNTPLSALKLQIQLRQRMMSQSDRPESTPSREKYLQMLESDERQVTRLVRLVKEMLDVTRLRQGRFSLSKSTVDLGNLVREVVDRFAGNLAAAGNTVEISTAPDVLGEWDPFRLEQIVTNLLTNAMKYGEARPIRIGVESRDGLAILRVRDQGMGIAPEDHGRIFTQFERAVSGTGISGLGLGLFIVRELVESHGGKIWVESELGKGAEFIVELPRQETGRSTPAPA